MSERKYVNYTIGVVDNKRMEMTIRLPFALSSTFKLVESDNNSPEGPAFVVLYAGNRVGSLFASTKSNGPAYDGPIAFPAIHEGRVRMADLYISVWPPDPDKNNRVNVTMSQRKNVDEDDEDTSAIPPSGGMFNQAS